MPDSIWAVVMREWRCLVSRMGIPNLAVYLAMVGVLGYLVPTSLGLGFLDPHLVLLYACSAPFFLVSVAVEAFSEARPLPAPRSVLAGKALAAALFGWGSSLLILTLALAAVNRSTAFEAIVVPEASLLAGSALLGLSLALFAASLAAVLAHRAPGPKQAKSALRRTLLYALLAVVLLARFGQAEWKDAFTGLLAGNGIYRLAGIGCPVLLAAAALLLRKAALDPRYRSR